MTKIDSDDSPVIRVLLVDDDENVRPLIEHMLRKVPGKRFQVDWVPSYQAGLDAIAKQNHNVCLVDYRLGAESGLDLVRKANSLGIQVPFIILTGAANPVIDLEATKIGASDFLQKDRLDTINLERSIRYSMQHFETLRALQKSNERFRLLFERSMDAILISEDDGKFLEVNGAACVMLGYGRDELLQLRISDLLEADGESFVQLRDKSVGELSFSLSNGERRYAEFSACRFAPNLNLCILRDITERRKLEKEIQEISEREQRRLGQDLHDGLGQMLTGINFLAKVLQQKLTAKELPEAEEAATIVTLINQALSQTRELARGLCPVVLENNDIQAALQQLSDTVENLFKVECRLVCDPKLKMEDNTVAIHLYRIAQEATTNAIRHGKAKHIGISLIPSKSYMVLQIRDDGCGIPEGGITAKGMGMRVMQHRARMIGATLDIERGPDGGTIVTCAVDSPGAVKSCDEFIRDAEAKRKRKKRAIAV